MLHEQLRPSESFSFALVPLQCFFHFCYNCRLSSSMMVKSRFSSHSPHPPLVFLLRIRHRVLCAIDGTLHVRLWESGMSGAPILKICPRMFTQRQRRKLYEIISALWNRFRNYVCFTSIRLRAKLLKPENLLGPRGDVRLVRSLIRPLPAFLRATVFTVYMLYVPQLPEQSTCSSYVIHQLSLWSHAEEKPTESYCSRCE